MKRLLIGLTVFCFCLGCAQDKGYSFVINPPAPSEGGDPEKEDQDPQNPEIQDNDAVKRTMEMGLGWNLGNQLDAYEEDPDDKDYLMPSETVWGNKPVTKEALRKVREAVAAIVKGWCSQDPEYTLQSVYDSAPKF